METTLIQQAQLLCPNHEFHQKKVDLLIENGIIKDIAAKIEVKANTTIHSENLYVSPGWIDCRAQFCDPGEEQKESLSTGTKSASAGGFTGVIVLPTLTLPRDQKSSIEYIVRNSGLNGVDLYPLGNLSHKAKGKQLSEMFDMQQSGAIGFTDDRNEVSSGLLKRALLYAKDIGASVSVVPFDNELVLNGQMHEGRVSTLNGLKGWPDIIETIRIERDLNILRYTGGKLHFSLISSAAAVELIKKAKSEGCQVTCDVAVHNLVYTEDDLQDFNTLFKVFPPLRSETDRKALIQGLEDNVIDAICSDHFPQDVEHKEMEFAHASWGMANIQTLFNELLKTGLKPEKLAQVLSIQPAKIYGLKKDITKGNKADITIFSTSEETDLSNNYYSLSPYNPLKGKKVKGKILATINGQFQYLNF